MLEPLQRGAGVEPELLPEHIARVLERLERIRLPARPVQREHQLRAKALTERVFDDEPLELENDLLLVAEVELVLNPLFADCQAELIEPGCFPAGERLVAEVRQRFATEESERLAELFRPGEPTVCRRFCSKLLEPADVDRVLGCEAQEVAGVLRFDPVGAEPLPQCGDMTVERRLRGFRGAFPPECLDAVVGGDDLAGVKHQECEQGAVLSPRRGQIDAIGFHLESAQQPVLQFVPIVSRRHA